MRISHGLRAAAGNQPFDFSDPANIGKAVQGGFFAGLISHTANGVATHALIVAPSATGASGTGHTLTTNYQWKTSDTTTSGTTSRYDGAGNTAAMSGGAHPAADFCTGLNIGGFTDWYLPARDELDIAYYNLKPTSSYDNNGFGANNYSVPKRTSNYTSGNPGQTSVAAFQSGGSEAFLTTTYYWSSTEVSSTTAAIYNFQYAYQVGTGKTNNFKVRAFRKIAL